MDYFGGLPIGVFHMLIKLLCPWNECNNWLSTRCLVNTILPLRLVNRQWRDAIDKCYYYWNFVRYTTPVLNQMNVPSSKETVIQYILKRKMIKSITGK